MSYLNITTIYNQDLDIFIEDCFNYALEQENEKLLELALLMELSNDLKLNAADKSFDQLSMFGDSEYFTDEKYTGLKNVRRWIRDAGNDYVKKERLNSQLQDDLNRAQRNYLKRSRIQSNYINTPVGTEFNSSYYSRHGERRPIKSKVNNGQQAFFKFALNNETKIKKEFEDIQNEINKTKQEIEDNASPWQRLSIKVRQKIRKFVNYLTKKYNDFRKKYRNTPPEKRGIIDRLLFGITEILEYLKDIIYMR